MASKIKKVTLDDYYDLHEVASFFQEDYDQSIFQTLSSFKVQDENQFADMKMEMNLLNKIKVEGKIESTDHRGYNIAHYAAARGKMSFFDWIEASDNEDLIAKLLLQRDPLRGNTPLMIAALNGQADVITWQLRMAKKFPILNSYLQQNSNLKGETQIAMAARSSNIKCFEAFLPLLNKENMAIQNKKG